MNLEQLITFRNLLKDNPSDWEADQFFDQLQNLHDLCQQHSFDLAPALTQVRAAYTHFDCELQGILNRVDQQIAAHDQICDQQSLEVWQGGERLTENTNILQRRFQPDDITYYHLLDRLKIKTNWQCPALIVRPAAAWHLEHLVSCDPMYWADTNQDLLDSLNHMFTPQYHRRLCKYVFEERLQGTMFDQLPQQQFGLIYASCFFNFRPLALLTQYLEEFFELLRPGGFAVFTFTNCDTVGGIRLFERFSGSYVPARLLKKVVSQIGYELIYEYSNGSVSWLELKKPGEFVSMRGGQTLAAIRDLPQDYSKVTEDLPGTSSTEHVDLHLDPMYNEVNTLIDICEMLNIDRSKTISKGQPNIRKMRKAISEHLRSEHFPGEKIARLLAKRKKT